MLRELHPSSQWEVAACTVEPLWLPWDLAPSSQPGCTTVKHSVHTYAPITCVGSDRLTHFANASFILVPLLACKESDRSRCKQGQRQ